ncbi:filamentous hemagglutinin N-terminal domain-containing protein [Pleurocapsa sp. PCC 7319]|uniref:two-partner secretion domain-containing protein n=1 Tax=Pleurocapsa sp. PCC 7319 TaxID=118161 RepID=UPI00034857E2|nr:filamentous hemagglutinin N-terminal domain-containing protein [Pleurocapsa sp. PCC 7319]
MVSIGDAIALLTPLVLLVGYCDHLNAQITPDRSLGNEASVVTPNVEIKGLPADRIDGGAIRDSNLFHSFQDFNIGDLQRVYFANPAGINNIFSRVTGSNLSEILGTLGVNGNANLFFINPNGIIFGENASLDVGGSFLGSTANSIVFPEGEFSASNVQEPPLLTINIPIGLNLPDNPGEIQLKNSNLRVDPSQNIVLLGGKIDSDGAALVAQGGRVDLGGLSQNGEIKFDNDGSLSFPNNIPRSNIFLRNQTVIRVDGEQGGNITLTGKNINITENTILQGGTSPETGLANSQSGDIIFNATKAVEINSSLIFNAVNAGDAGNIIILADSLSLANSTNMLNSTFGEGNAGSVFIEVDDFVSLADPGTFIDTGVRATGIGQGGNINIRAASLSISNRAQLVSAIFNDNIDMVAGQGNAGDINIDVSGAVTIKDAPSGLFSLVSTGAIGNGGNINISASSLSMSDGSNIFANSNGGGNGGLIQIDATDFVRILGTSNIRGDSSEISARTNSAHRGGDITINTNIFSLSNGGVINTQTVNDGDSGNITINVQQAEVLNGGQILSNSSGRGNAGKIALDATDFVIIAGVDTTLNDRVAKFGTSRGIINTLENGASGFFVRAEDSGSSGDLEITSPAIQLEDGGRIFADSAFGNGGNITIDTEKIVLLRLGSAISTTAGTAESGGDGGDINIDADLVVAFPQENSDITANAFSGKGGNINIDTQNIFGFELQENSNLSDITASSQFGLDGTVNINTSGIEPAQELGKLPIEIVDVSELINQNLCSAEQKGAFILTGKGGLSPSPKDTLNTDSGWEDWRILENSEFNHQQSSQTQSTEDSVRRSLLAENNHDSHQIVEAQSWFIAPNGNIILSAQPVKSVSRSSSFMSPDCRSLDQLQP